MEEWMVRHTHTHYIPTYSMCIYDIHGDIIPDDYNFAALSNKVGVALILLMGIY